MGTSIFKPFSICTHEAGVIQGYTDSFPEINFSEWYLNLDQNEGCLLCYDETV